MTNDPPPFPLTHENLDHEEADILAAIESANQVLAGMSDPILAAIRLSDIMLLDMLDEWRAELLRREAQTQQNRPTD